MATTSQPCNILRRNGRHRSDQRNVLQASLQAVSVLPMGSWVASVTSAGILLSMKTHGKCSNNVGPCCLWKDNRRVMIDIVGTEHLVARKPSIASGSFASHFPIRSSKRKT